MLCLWSFGAAKHAFRIPSHFVIGRLWRNFAVAMANGLSLGTLLLAGLILGLGPVLSRCVHAENISASRNVFAYDIAGIAVRCGEDVLPSVCAIAS